MRGAVIRHTVAAFVAAAVTAGAFASLLFWDTKRELGSDGSLHGPYDSWQVILLVLIIAVVAVLGGWYDTVLTTALSAACAAVVCFAHIGISDPMGDGLWPIGAILTGGATFLGCWGFGAATRAHRPSVERRLAIRRARREEP